jgi:hypothetical protein
MANGLVIQPGGAQADIHCTGKWKLDTMRECIGGGYIELVDMPPNSMYDTAVVDEDGLNKDLDFNNNASVLASRRLVGTVLFCNRKDID